jgi:hypothetical protein
MSRGDKAGCAMERRAGSREGRPGVDVDDGLTVRGWLAGEVFPGLQVGWLAAVPWIGGRALLGGGTGQATLATYSRIHLS